MHITKRMLLSFLAVFTVQKVMAEKKDELGYRYNNVELTIEMSKPQTLKLEKCPLYDNRSWALSARWDDSNSANFKMNEVMHNNGWKGNFYLNTRSWGQKYDYKALLKYDSRIGGHTSNHYALPLVQPNLIFKEILENKIMIEAKTDLPVNSFAFPYGAYKSKYNNKLPEDIREVMTRSGYNHSIYSGFVKVAYGLDNKIMSSVNQLVPGDRKPDKVKFSKQFNALIKKRSAQELNPNITIGVHAWQKGEAWTTIGEIYKMMSGNKNYWYCSQNDYAAYRYMFKNTNISKVGQTGNKVKYDLKIPFAADTGSDIPLTIKVHGTVKKITYCGKDLPFRQERETTIFSLPPARDTAIPKTIAMIKNSKNSATPPAGKSIKKFPGILVWLYYDNKNEILKLILKNDTNRSLKQLCIRFRLPLQYSTGIHTINIPELAAKSDCVKELRIKSLIKKDSEYNGGIPFFVAQIDFSGGRIYATTEYYDKKCEKQFCARDLVSVYAPLDEKDIDNQKLQNMSNPDEKLGLLSKDKPMIFWAQETDRNRKIYLPIQINIASHAKHKYWTTRSILSKKGKYSICAMDFNSTDGNPVMLDFLGSNKVKSIFANGKPIKKERIVKIPVRKGKNRVVFACHAPKESIQLVIKK